MWIFTKFKMKMVTAIIFVIFNGEIQAPEYGKGSLRVLFSFFGGGMVASC